MLPKPEQACWFKQSFLFWHVFFGIWKGIHLYSLSSNKTHENMRIWLKIIDPETESEQRVNFCLEPETSAYKWLFQIGCFQMTTWNNHSFKTGCLGYQVSKHEDNLWFLVVVLYPTFGEADETFWNLEILRVYSTFFEFLTPFPLKNATVDGSEILNNHLHGMYRNL